MVKYKLLLILGTSPFLVPFIYHLILFMFHHTAVSLIEVVVLWSYLYWPSYVLGLLLVIFSAYKIKKGKDY